MIRSGQRIYAEKGLPVKATGSKPRMISSQLVKTFKPNIVLLNLYLKYGFRVWDVLRNIKIQEPNLPVLIIAPYHNYLFDHRLSQADGYLLKSHSAADELKQKISALLENNLTK